MTNSRTTKQENSGYLVDTWCFDASKVNSITRYFEVPFLLPLLDFNSVISKPHNSNFLTILLWDHLSVVNREGDAGRQKGTSSLATGQSCSNRFGAWKERRLTQAQVFNLSGPDIVEGNGIRWNRRKGEQSLPDRFHHVRPVRSSLSLPLFVRTIKIRRVIGDCCILISCFVK